MSGVVVEAADEGEAAACLALLPEALNLDCVVLVARREGRVLGAAAIVWKSWSAPAGFPVWVHVPPPYRRQGVGRALIEAARVAVRGESPGLWALRPQGPDDAGALFLEASGFEPLRIQHFFEADVSAMAAIIEPLMRREAERGGDRGRLVDVGLDRAPLQEAGWLVAAEFGGGPLGALQRLHRRVESQSRAPDDRSFVLMDADKVAGVMLCRLANGRYLVEGRVIAPGWRNSRSNLVLLARTARRAQEEGVARFQFHCDSDVYDTLKLARRCGADALFTRALHYQAVAG